MTRAPDFLEPLIGFRGWHVGADGVLAPWAFPHEAWVPGPNRATCRSTAHHRPPVGSCMCGLYGLTRPDDARLDFDGDQAVGAIAAWGEIEAHPTGFRAEWACVTALAEPPRRAGAVDRARVERAAVRYDVPVVPREQLFAEAQRWGAPLPAGTWREPRPRAGDVPPLETAHLSGHDRGIATEEHLWVTAHGRTLRVGITEAFAARLGALDGSFPLPPAGRRVARGDVLTVLGAPAASFHVVTAFAGEVLATNPVLARDPARLLADPRGAGWLAELRPSRWHQDARRVAWGPSRGRAYAAALAAAPDDPFAALHVERVRALPPVASWGELRDVLRRERAAPRFTSAADVHERLGRGLLAALAADAARPPPDLLLRLREPDAVLRVGDAAPRLELSLTAEAAHDLLTGRLDPAVAVRAGVVASSAPAAPTLIALGRLARVRLRRVERRPSWGR